MNAPKLEICTKCRRTIPKGKTYIIDDCNDVVCNDCSRSHGSGNNSQEERVRIRKEDSTNNISDLLAPENSLAINGVGTPDKHSQNTGRSS